MLTMLGSKRTLCDGISRRNFLRAGFLGLGGLTMSELFRLRAETGAATDTAVILAFLAGGPSHLETYDMKF
jgi:hypothetical protein